MAGSQCPLESLPDSRSLGVKLHPEPISVVVCGAYNAGKTALITRYCIHYFVTGYDPSGEDWSCQRTFNETPYLLEFVEVPGTWALEELSALKASLKRVDALLFVYDIGDPKSFEKMKDIYENVVATLGEGVHVPVGVVAAKSDMMRKEKWQVEAEEGREFASRLGGVFAVCSAKEGEGVEDAVERPVTVAVEGKMKLLREREERHQERMEMCQERGRKSENTATVMEKVRRWLPFGKQ